MVLATVIVYTQLSSCVTIHYMAWQLGKSQAANDIRLKIPKIHLVAASMASVVDLDTFVGRISTFEEPQPLEKRRVSTTKKKTPTTASWPHDRPNPEQVSSIRCLQRVEKLMLVPF